MKNLKMARKLGIGFGLVTALVCVLGYMSFTALSDASLTMNKIANAYVPASDTASNALDDVRVVRISIRQFEMSGNQADYDEAMAHIAEMRPEFERMQVISRANPELQTLAATVRDYPPLYQGYKEGCEATAVQVTKAEAARKIMIESANKAEEAMQWLMNGIYENQKKAYAAGDTAALLKGSESLLLTAQAELMFKEMRRIYATARLNYDTSVSGQMRELGDKARNSLNTLHANLITEEGRGKCKTVLDAADAYIANLNNLLTVWDSINKAASQRREVSAKFVDMLENLNKAANKNSESFSVAAVGQVSAAMQRVIVISAIMVVIAIALSLVLTRLITAPLAQSMRFAQAVAGGNLDETLVVSSRDEVGKLADALRAMVTTLKGKIKESAEQAEQARKMGAEARTAMEEAKKAQAEAESAKREGMLDAARQLEGIVEVISSASAELSGQVEESERGTALTSERLTETATAMEEMNATVLEVAHSAGSAAEASNSARKKAEIGSGIVEDVVRRIGDVERQASQLKNDMGQLGQQAESIGAILNVISDIADQTNLLALNAAIEAARAGEAGRGFAVVADEVRKLAEKTMTATVEVGNAIKGVQQSANKNIQNVDVSVRSIGEATALARQAGDALHEIVVMVENSADQVRTIATAAEEQSATSEEINRALGAVSNTSSDTARAMSEAAHAVADLAMQAQKLSSLIEHMQHA